MFVRFAGAFVGVLFAGMTVTTADHAGYLTAPLPLTPVGQPVGGFPDGAPASPPPEFKLTQAETSFLKQRGFTAGIAMQALDTPWNSLQVAAITSTLASHGIEVVMVTDASQNPSRQADHLAAMISRKVSVIFSVPIDPASQSAAYKRVSDAGIKLILMDNVPQNLTPGREYATVVASDNEKNAVFATEELIAGIGGEGDIGLITYFYDSYYSIAARRIGFEKTVASHPKVRVVAVERFTQPREVYQKTLTMLNANPSIKGIFAVWGDPAMQAVAAAKALGRSVIITTNDLGPDTAMYVARGEIRALGAQLPFDLGIAEAQAAILALLGKPVPPYISLPALRVKKENLISALELVTKQIAPPGLKEACGSSCH